MHERAQASHRLGPPVRLDNRPAGFSPRRAVPLHRRFRDRLFPRSHLRSNGTCGHVAHLGDDGRHRAVLRREEQALRGPALAARELL